MYKAERFTYIEQKAEAGEAGLLPELPLTLTYQQCSIAMSGLLDSGATVNVLPHNLGLQLGAIWQPQARALRLTGNLANFEAQPLIVSASIGQFPPVRLAFAWTQAEAVPLILGQVNFFMEFDVCFYRSQRAFEISQKV